jgi:hypothetical protein
MRARWLRTLLCALVGLTAVFLPAGVTAQTQERCFPEIGHCIRWRLRSFWEQIRTSHQQGEAFV